MKLEIIVIAILALIATLFGYFLKSYLIQKKKDNLDLKIKTMELDAEKKVMELLNQGEKDKNRIIKEGLDDLKIKINQYENDKKKLEEKREKLDDIKNELEKKGISLYAKEKDYIQKLESVSKLSQEEAKEEIFADLERQHKEDLFVSSRRLENDRKAILEKKAKDIIASAIQKYSGEVNRSLVSTVVKISSDDEKGKLIGKDGRNIRTFERVTGVQLIIDEGPEVVTVSSFDPIRREVAVRVLNKMLDDGIVQPAKIEEYYEESAKEVLDIIQEKGNNAVNEVGLYNLDPELIQILGRLYFRTSYGQNVLQHSLEMAHIAGVIAEELGANVNVTKAAALFHDIGKAVDFETEGTHVEIGRKILKQYKIDEEIIKAMQSHHKEYPNENIESYIIDAADAISASRTGARSDNAEMYIQKLAGLERITSEFEGVNEAYALSAGREVRVFVKPDIVNDHLAKKMAREIALKIEDELKYPGEIKVAVIRESKVIEFAR